MVLAGLYSGNPGARLRLRPTFRDCSPTWETHRVMLSWIYPASLPERCTDSAGAGGHAGEREAAMGEGTWASGSWHVQDGKADEFMGRWRDWLSSTSQQVPGFRSARLLRSKEDALRFTSMSEWADDASREAWK